MILSTRYRQTKQKHHKNLWLTHKKTAARAACAGATVSVFVIYRCIGIVLSAQSLFRRFYLPHFTHQERAWYPFSSTYPYTGTTAGTASAENV